MKHRAIVTLSVISLAAAAWMLLASPPAESQDVSFVRVTNFPTPQVVSGAVEISNTIRQSEALALREIIVPPVPASQTTRWVNAGTIQTDGFPNIVLSLHGEIKGEVTEPGDVVALLIPIEQSVTEAFELRGQTHFSMRVSAEDLRGGMAFFASDQPRYTVAFPTYRVWMYNGTDKTVTAHLFAYLTN
jgi:hypothetical protein